jgi:hypothetical protein
MLENYRDFPMKIRLIFIMILCLSLASLPGCMGAVEQQIEQVNTAVAQAEQAKRAAAEANFESLSQIAVVENDGIGYVDFYNSASSPMAVKIVHAEFAEAWKLLELPTQSKQNLEVGPGRYLLKVRVDSPGETMFYESAGFDLKAGKRYKFTLKLNGDLLDLGSLGVTVIDATEYSR